MPEIAGEAVILSPSLFVASTLNLFPAATTNVAGRTHRLPSGPLHDAAEVARCGIPSVMMFVQSLGGISHNKIENTREDHLAMAVEAYAELAEQTAAWILERR